jgi:putative transposase
MRHPPLPMPDSPLEWMMHDIREYESGKNACMCQCWSRSVCPPTVNAWCSICGWPEARVSKPGWKPCAHRVARNLGTPVLAVIDGNPGLAAALRMRWPQIALQRCTNHKLWNLLAKAPAHLREELAEDYRRMIYAPNRAAVEQARVGFLRKWKLRCKAASASFEEADDELFTFTAFPASQWKALRTTNALERINEEFRRRTKTQASLPSEEAVLFLLFGLLRSGQVKLRRLVGWQDLATSQMEAA